MLANRMVWTVALAGGVIITTSLVVSDALIGPPGPVASIILWPVTVLLGVVGPGVPSRQAPSLQPRYEWTPLQDVAVAVGIGLSWAFYVLVGAYLVNVFRHHLRTQRP